MEGTWKSLFIKPMGAITEKQQFIEFADTQVLKYMLWLHGTLFLVSRFVTHMGIEVIPMRTMFILGIIAWGLCTLWLQCSVKHSLQVTICSALTVSSALLLLPLYSLPGIFILSVEVITWFLFCLITILSDIVTLSWEQWRWPMISILMFSIGVEIFVSLGLAIKMPFVLQLMTALIELIGIIYVSAFTMYKFRVGSELIYKNCKSEIVGQFTNDVLPFKTYMIKVLYRHSFIFLPLYYLNFIVLLIFVVQYIMRGIAFIQAVVK